MQDSQPSANSCTIKSYSSTVAEPLGRVVLDEVRWALEVPATTIVHAISGLRTVFRLEQHFDRGFGYTKPVDGPEVEASDSRKSHLRRMVIRAVTNGR